MNRNQRRHPKNEISNESYKSKYLEFLLVMMAYTIEYKLELDKEELESILKTILDNIDSYRTGQLNSEDFKYIKNELKEKGIIINIK